MKSFKELLAEEILLELFDKPLPFSWEEITPNSWYASFKIDKQHYGVDIYITNDSPDPDIEQGWEIVFGVGKDRMGLDIGILNTGNEIKVFSTVVAAIKEWYKLNKNHPFWFSAKEPSRVKLYKAFARLIKKEIGRSHKLIKKKETYFVFNT